jgi:hypothetical protein
MTMSHDQTSPASPHSPTSPGSPAIAQAILWGCAFLLAAVVILKAGSLPEHPAWAGMATGGAGYTLVTADAGRGGDTKPNELLYVLDGRGETLYVYEIEDAKDRRITLVGGNTLPGLFRAARGR